MFNFNIDVRKFYYNYHVGGWFMYIFQLKSAQKQPQIYDENGKHCSNFVNKIK